MNRHRRYRRSRNPYPEAGSMLAITAGAAFAMGALAMVADEVDNEPVQRTYYFNASCKTAEDTPWVSGVQQNELFETDDTISVACSNPDTHVSQWDDLPHSLSLLTDKEGAELAVTVRYHDDMFDKGAPQVETDGLLGRIAFLGDISTITGWEVIANNNSEKG